MTQKRNTEKKPQCCPICKKYVKSSSRYLNYICKKCILLASDENNKPVYFHNTEVSGHGCAGRYLSINKPYLSNTCYVKGIKCNAQEAYFGGIVIIVV